MVGRRFRVRTFLYPGDEPTAAQAALVRTLGLPDDVDRLHDLVVQDVRVHPADAAVEIEQTARSSLLQDERDADVVAGMAEPEVFWTRHAAVIADVAAEAVRSLCVPVEVARLLAGPAAIVVQAEPLGDAPGAVPATRLDLGAEGGPEAVVVQVTFEQVVDAPAVARRVRDDLDMSTGVLRPAGVSALGDELRATWLIEAPPAEDSIVALLGAASDALLLVERLERDLGGALVAGRLTVRAHR